MVQCRCEGRLSKLGEKLIDAQAGLADERSERTALKHSWKRQDGPGRCAHEPHLTALAAIRMNDKPQPFKGPLTVAR